MFKTILVLEAPWDETSVDSPSVWPFVSEFARIRGIRAYRQTFSDRASFEHWVACYNDEAIPGTKMLYVAAHGANGRIASLRKMINRETVIEVIRKAKNIPYVHFGTCWFGSEANLQSLLAVADHVKWAAGYEKRVDWVDSTLFDIMFWGRVESRDKETKGKKTHILTTALLNQVQGLAAQLGFRFQHRYGTKIKEVTARGAKA